jgi:homocysteine S-methyltransferase
LRQRLAEHCVVLDGGMGTQLEARGNDVSSLLWSAEILRRAPEEVTAVHRDFFAAGARAATAASYQVSYSAFAGHGVGAHEVDVLLQQSVDLAAAARFNAGMTAEEALVFASVGPFGASRGDGSEYTGDYGMTVEELRTWHARRIEVLALTNADALLCETIPSLDEVRALREVLTCIDAPAMLSFTVSDGALRSGESIAEAVRIASDTPHLVAIGVNCSDVTSTDRALRLMRDVTDLPLIAYPNSGEVWDARSRSWSGTAHAIADAVPGWLELGVSLVGGCCRVDTTELSKIALAVAATRP